MDFSEAFIGPSYTLPSVKAGAQRSVNLYLEINEAEERRALVYTPGLTLRSTLGAGPNRGLFTASNERSFAASGNKLYEITDSVNPVNVGSLVTSSGKVSMADNGVHLLCVDGSRGYTFKFSDSTFAQIADPDFPVANYCTFIDQYLIVNNSGTGNFFLSDLSDATSWNGLDFAAAEGYPDKVVRLMSDRRELILVGSQSIELWFDSGPTALSTFPFSRDQGGSLDQGSLAPDSWQKVDGGWCGVVRDANGTGIVARLSGVSLQRLSTFAVEAALKAGGNLFTASAWSYQDRGHTFYCLNVPELTSTWCLDVASGQWHERQSSGARHRAENHCIANGLHIVGDYQNGKLYSLDSTIFTENGAAMTWTRRCPRITKELAHLSIAELTLDMDAAGDQSAISLRISRDGGKTFKTPRTLAASDSVRFRRLGEARDWVIEVSGTGPATIVGAYIDPEAGRW